MHKRIIALIVACGLCIAFYNLITSPQPADPEDATKGLVNEAESSNNQSKSQSHNSVTSNSLPHTKNISMPIEDRMLAMSFRRSGEKFNQNEVENALSQQEAWKISKLQPLDLPLDESERNDGRIFIDANPLKFETLMKNDQFTLTVPQSNSTYTMTVNEVVIKEGVLQWRVSSDEQSNTQAIITSGNNFISGSITDSKTHYSFRLYEGQGWIHETGKLFVNPNASPDVIDTP